MNQPSIGHNMPPPETELLLGRLEEGSVDLVTRYTELEDAIKRMPFSCDDAATAKKLTAFGTQMKDCADKLEAKRVLEKKPYDNLAATVQNFFKGRIDNLTVGMTKTKALLNGWQAKETKRLQEEAAAKRRAEEDEAARQREVAQKLADQAAALDEAGKKASAAVVLDRAQEAEQQANQIAANAALPSKPVQAGMIRSDTGGSAGSTGRWVAEIADVNDLDMDILREHLDRDALQKALNAWMRLKVKPLKKDDPAPTIKGARIFRESNIQFRS